MLTYLKANILKLQRFDWEHILHGLKTVVACIVGVIVGKLTTLPLPWILITIAVVMCSQLRLGAVVQKSYMRFLGTLLGAAIAALTIVFYDHNQWIKLVVVCTAMFVFSYMATSKSKLSDAGTLGAATVAVILYTPNSTLQTAGMRFAEISLGIVIAFLVSRFVFPQRSRTRLIHNIVGVLDNLKKFYSLLVDPAKQNLLNQLERDEEIIDSLLVQRKLFPEAAKESLSSSFTTAIFNEILQCEREILRCISFIGTALHNISPVNYTLLGSNAALREFNKSVAKRLEEIMIQLQTWQFVALPPLSEPAHSFQQQVKQTIMAANQNLPAGDILYLDAFLFCIEYLSQHLNELANVIQKLKT